MHVTIGEKWLFDLNCLSCRSKTRTKQLKLFSQIGVFNTNLWRVHKVSASGVAQTFKLRVPKKTTFFFGTCKALLEVEVRVLIRSRQRVLVNKLFFSQKWFASSATNIFPSIVCCWCFDSFFARSVCFNKQQAEKFQLRSSSTSLQVHYVKPLTFLQWLKISTTSSSWKLRFHSAAECTCFFTDYRLFSLPIFKQPHKQQFSVKSNSFQQMKLNAMTYLKQIQLLLVKLDQRTHICTSYEPSGKKPIHWNHWNLKKGVGVKRAEAEATFIESVFQN